MELKTNRVAVRRALFDKYFRRVKGDADHRGLLSRQERRNLARAYAAAEWRKGRAR